MHRILSICVVLLITILSCKPTQKISKSTADVVNLDTVNVSAVPQPQRYNPSRKQYFDLLHTRLDIQFNWEKQHLNGKATITLKPYFYPSSELKLDAKGFEIGMVALAGANGERKPLPFIYENQVIVLSLNREYTRNDTFVVYIEYTAKPNELPDEGSAAITSRKGLYFINPDEKDPDKPRQIWTQGETESSSCWFPTIDSPNERMTQEFFISVDKKLKTLSNGLLISQTENADGTRTDHWKQEVPHAPYLAMMAVGEFAIVKDKWRNMDVWYYVDPEYEPYAKAIFGLTPEMLEFFSKKLGVDYPWEKFSQVAVHDFVSGAMENSSAVVHGSFIQRNSRELLDENYEEYIAHELFHHWFGDLVTCESWANLPLNESFATYGEYLWNEYKYGRDFADFGLREDLNKYLQESRYKQVDMIRYDYNDKEDMFDSHSYAKGGTILNMLRRYVGDDAFFNSLQLYLSLNKFNSVEIHDLRKAFEKMTGEDLNWFFNQWFLSSGHPELQIEYAYDSLNKQQKVVIEQRQNFSSAPLFRLPMAVDIYCQGVVKRHDIVVSRPFEEFFFDASAKPDLVNVDAEKMLLCTKTDKKSISGWVFQYYHAPLYVDRYEAVERCAAVALKDTAALRVVTDALNDKHWNIRKLAIKNMVAKTPEHEVSRKQKMTRIALTDEKSEVRSSAIHYLREHYKDSSLTEEVYKKALNDSSYDVVAEALFSLAEANPEEAMKLAKSYENEKSSRIIMAVAQIFSEKGSEAENDFFVKNINKISGLEKIAMILHYENFLNNDLSEETLKSGMDILALLAKNDKTFYVRVYALQALKEMKDELNKKTKKLTEEITGMEKKKLQSDELNKRRNELEKINRLTKTLTGVLDEIKSDESLLKMMERLGN